MKAKNTETRGKALEPSVRLQGLPPIADDQTRVLVLGSFPSVASLRSQAYYGHPQNHFWRILGEVWGLALKGESYENRIQALHRHHVGVWDVYQSCERPGSLDADIRDAVPNDIASLIRRCPSLQAIAHNGGESFRHASQTRRFGLPVYRLPSTSPANASWSFDRKLQSWKEILLRHGCGPV